MISKSKEFIPVLIDFSDGSSGWGRLLEIHPKGATLLTMCRLARGNVMACGKDADGYLSLKLTFLDNSQTADIRGRLLDMFNRS